MKVTKPGVVIVDCLDASLIKIEGWEIEREISDPPDMTGEELVLAAAIDTAERIFKQAVLNAKVNVLRAWYKAAGEKQNEVLGSAKQKSLQSGHQAS